MMLVSSVIERWRTRGDLRALRAADAREAPIDGKVAALVGPISPIGFPLRGPVSDSPCVGYEYEVNTDSPNRYRSGSGSRKQSTRHMSGIALTPSTVGSATHGAVRLLSFPLMEGFPSTRYSGPAAQGRFRHFVESTSFETRSMVSALGAFTGAFTDDDGAVRVDYALGGKKELPAGAWFSERIIPTGTMVCALGRYSADRRALIAHGTSFIRLISGDAATARFSIVKKSRSQVFVALFFFTVSHAFLGAVSYLSSTRYAHGPSTEQVRVLTDAIGSHDTKALELAVRRGADPNIMNSAGEVPVQLAADPETAHTLARLGADVNATGGSGRTPLMFAVMRHRADMVQAWIAAGADIHLARPDGATALTDAEESGEDDDIVEILRTAGARCDHVGEANGAPLLSDGGLPFAAVRDYLAAVHRKDLPRLRALTQGRAPGFFETVDFDVWQKTRPAAPQLASGYASATAATLTLQSVDAMDVTLVWAYQLARGPNGWQITREWARRTDDVAAPVPSHEPIVPVGPDAPVERPRPSDVPDPVERPRPPA
jgi:hypothetical protein